MNYFKRLSIVSLMGLGFFISITNSLFAAYEEDERKALEIHQLASSDVIYTDQETKALYYQNRVIISLLKDIREIMDSQRRILLEKESDEIN